MPVLKNIGILATCAADGGQGNIHLTHHASLAWKGDRIEWVGLESDLPLEWRDVETIDAGGRLVIPGLVDSHTHLAFGGWRADEFEQRIRGRSYQEIAQAGGGIASTVTKTRALDEDALFQRARGFLGEMTSLGVTTVECKSGYGLDLENELKLLRVYRRLADTQPVRIVATFLGAHIVPLEFQNRRQEYVDLVVNQMIPAVALERLAVFCDVFVEEGAFSIEEGRRILLAGLAAGLRPKVHADQLTGGGGAELAAEVGAQSAEHLECISDAGIQALARSRTVATSLPLASLYLHHAPMPARRLIDAGAAVAVATDFNPGTAPSLHLPLALFLACTLQRMTPAEALKGATLYAARALGLEDRVGSLERGKAADFAVLDTESVNHWLYHFRANACVLTVCGGAIIHPTDPARRVRAPASL
jgi:imidazolonepropionase